MMARAEGATALCRLSAECRGSVLTPWENISTIASHKLVQGLGHCILRGRREKKREADLARPQVKGYHCG